MLEFCNDIGTIMIDYPFDEIGHSPSWNLWLCPQLKIFYSVVIPNTVFVVDALKTLQFPSQVLRHYKPMLKKVFPPDAYAGIA